MAPPERKWLLVEGQDDLYAVVQLMAQHIAWGNRRQNWPVTIKVSGSVSELLEPAYLSGQLKSREVEILGIMVDANESFDHRWAAIREQCRVSFPNIPNNLPPEGLILQNDQRKRLGVWIMPDNASRGMLETFLRFLVPNNQEPIWVLAQKAVADAVAAGARCRQVHLDKANIHTWLAWQDPPGEDFGNALVKAILNPHSPNAMSFVKWFRDLYEI